MDIKTNQDLAKKLQISPENVAREEYEMIFLKALLESPWGKYLVFKGGTALRLVYHSQRFSEDLDFSVRRSIDWPQLKQILEAASSDLPAIRKKDLREKRNTFFSLFSIKEDFLPQPFLLKIEISKRPVKWMQSKDFELKQLVSPVTPLGVSGFVVTLKRAFLDKKKAFRERVKGRDLYDLWWLAQQLGEKRPELNGRFNKRQISSELKRFLPKDNWWLIEDLLKT